MSFFLIKNNKFVPVKEKSFNSELYLQQLIEKNLAGIFGLEFIKGSLNGEFYIKGTHQGLSFDTIAFDPQTRAFVIIEYKKDRSFSVIDQGYAYLSTLLNNKSAFILEYREQKNIPLKEKDVDWNQTRLIFISPEFTPYQKAAIGFRDVPFELYEAKLFDGGFCSLTQIKATETQESIAKFTKNPTVKKVSEEVQTFTFDYHLDRASDQTKILLKNLRDKIFALDEHVKEKPVKNYLGYKINWYNFVVVFVFKDKLKIHVRVKNLTSDERKRFAKIPASYKWGTTPLWWIDISKQSDLDYAMKAIEESYKKAPDR